MGARKGIGMETFTAVVDWLTPDRITALGVLAGAVGVLLAAISAFLHTLWAARERGELTAESSLRAYSAQLRNVGKAAHDVVERLAPMLPKGGAPEQFVKTFHQLANAMGLDDVPDDDALKALGTALHEEAKAEAFRGERPPIPVTGRAMDPVPVDPEEVK